MPYCLATDIGASGERHLPGELKDGRLETQEIYRFGNGMKSVDGTLTWDIDTLFHHMVAGIVRCKEVGKIPATMVIDTWGVDCVLLDEAGRIPVP